MAQVKDITTYPNGLIEVVFEDENGRDVAFFHDRVDEQTIEELKVWIPDPDAVTVSFEMGAELADVLQQWCEMRGLKLEQLLRAFTAFIAHHGSEWWARLRKTAEAVIQTDETGGKQNDA